MNHVLKMGKMNNKRSKTNNKTQPALCVLKNHDDGGNRILLTMSTPKINSNGKYVIGGRNPLVVKLSASTAKVTVPPDWLIVKPIESRLLEVFGGSVLKRASRKAPAIV